MSPSGESRSPPGDRNFSRYVSSGYKFPTFSPALLLSPELNEGMTWTNDKTWEIIQTIPLVFLFSLSWFRLLSRATWSFHAIFFLHERMFGLGHLFVLLSHSIPVLSFLLHSLSCDSLISRSHFTTGQVKTTETNCVSSTGEGVTVVGLEDDYARLCRTFEDFPAGNMSSVGMCVMARPEATQSRNPNQIFVLKFSSISVAAGKVLLCVWWCGGGVHIAVCPSVSTSHSNHPHLQV